MNEKRNMIDNMSTQQRMFLAIALSFLFFVGYSTLLPPVKKTDTNNTKEVKNGSKITTSTPESPSNSLQSQPQTATLNTNSPTAPNSKTVPKVVNKSNIIATVDSKDFKIEIDNLGRIWQFTLKDEKYHSKNTKSFIEKLFFSKSESEEKSDKKNGELFDVGKLPKPLELRFSDKPINEQAFKVNYTSDKSSLNLEDSNSIILTQKLDKITITKKIIFNKNGSYSVQISGTDGYEYYISSGFRPSVEVDGFAIHGVILKKKDNTTEVIEDGDAEDNQNFADILFAAASDKYYTTAFYSLNKPLSVSLLHDKDNNPEVFIAGKNDFTVSGYIGPKNYDILNSINPMMTDIIEYGFFTWIAKPVFLLLKFLFGMVGNWGWAIVLTTVLIRLVLYPLTYKGMVSMNKLKELSPKIKEIQAKYKGDHQKINAHTMELYKNHGANPMGGCLPMLLQIPVFFAIYRVLLNSVELKSADWMLWITDLSLKDPYFVLPVLMGATMFWHQRITPSNFTDPMQEKIMKWLPVIFTFFFVTFPAGLTLYWFINNIFSIVQQYYVNKIFETQKQVQIDKKHKNKIEVEK